MKVLVVDPDPKRAPVLQQTLLAGGTDVTVAPSGSFALTMLEWNRHDIVVSRGRLDDMGGHELCAIIKADPGTRDVRFVLVASSDEVSPAESAAAGVDLVLPPAMAGSAIVPLIVRLMNADRAPVPPAAAAESSRPATPAPPPDATVETPEATPESLVPRLRPDAVSAPEPDPPRRYVTAGKAAAASPWSKTGPEIPVPTAANAPPLPSVAPPAVPVQAAPTKTPPSRPSKPTPPPAPAAPARPPGRPAATPPAASKPVSAPPSAPPTTAAELLSMPSGTFQGSLEVMELADLAQAIAAGGKSGRLILALTQGGGLMLFDKGRVVHAEYRNTVGEEAFGALLAACHGDGAGRFCFLPTPVGQSSSGQPRTIDKALDRLLLSSATAIDEKG
jgi:CheY-like chemotaxis protein